MSELHVRQIRAYLEKNFVSVIDCSDICDRPAPDRGIQCLTRALSAFAVAYLTKIEPMEAAKAVTDGWNDNGLDAIYYHAADRVLYLVQSKWRQDGSGTIDRGDTQKFLKGFKDLLNARWNRFNPKVLARSSELDAVLDDATTRIVLLIVSTGQEPISEHVWQDLQDVINEINDPTELVSVQTFRQADVYAAVAQGLEGAAIDVDVALYDWGQVRDPYVGFYGQVSASDIAEWVSTHQNRLFAPNIRMFLGATDVNETIVRTLLNDPEDFWYFNNGITALCRTIKKKPLGGNTRETGIFECNDLRVVNGAQTAGAITRVAAKAPERVAAARVAIRLIALESCPPEFGKKVTRYTNTQNRIDRRDFVALDIQQERIRGELQLEGVSYIYKSGETQSPSAIGFDLVEATIARSCLQRDVSLAVQAKREIGKLWDDIYKSPYTILFNTSLSGPALWRSVQAVRQVERVLQALRPAAGGRERLLAVHGNRFITHLVFLRLPGDFTMQHNVLTSEEEKSIGEITKSVFNEVLESVNTLYPDTYLASLFKNLKKCQALKEMVT